MSSLFRELMQLHARVWIFPSDDTGATSQPNVGIVRGDKQTFLIGAGNSPRHARLIMTEMAGRHFPPIETVIYTHHHWENVFGACAFNPSMVVAHEECVPHLRQMASKTWTPLGLREESARYPQLEARNTQMQQAVGDWRDFRVVLPTVSIASKVRLVVAEGVFMDVVHITQAQEEDVLIVKIPVAKVMFLGNCFYASGAHPSKKNNSSRVRLSVLEAVYSPQYEWFVDGHHQPFTREQFEALIAKERASKPD